MGKKVQTGTASLLAIDSLRIFPLPLLLPLFERSLHQSIHPNSATSSIRVVVHPKPPTALPIFPLLPDPIASRQTSPHSPSLETTAHHLFLVPNTHEPSPPPRRKTFTPSQTTPTSPSHPKLFHQTHNASQHSLPALNQAYTPSLSSLPTLSKLRSRPCFRSPRLISSIRQKSSFRHVRSRCQQRV